MCPATSPSHSDMNQHCHVSTDLISFAHRAVLNPKVSSFVALYSTNDVETSINPGFFFGLFQKNSSPKKLKLKEFSKKLKLKFQEKLKNPAIEVANIG